MSEREKALEAALLPCPFCGDPMKHWGHGEVIHVNGDRCIVGKNGFFVAAWNTRAALAMPATVGRRPNQKVGSFTNMSDQDRHELADMLEAEFARPPEDAP